MALDSPRLRGMAGNGTFTIAQISDLHCGGPYFLPNLLERAVTEVNDLEPDIVVCSGDLTTFGFKEEYRQAKSYLDRIECKTLVVIPGNHDSRNVGYVHFEELFGEPALFRVFVCHHHLLPVPGTGRERNVIYDAGDAIECLQRAGVNLVLSGHK